jgi:hypothetical protein
MAADVSYSKEKILVEATPNNNGGASVGLLK